MYPKVQVLWVFPQPLFPLNSGRTCENSGTGVRTLSDPSNNLIPFILKFELSLSTKTTFPHFTSSSVLILQSISVEKMTEDCKGLMEKNPIPFMIHSLFQTWLRMMLTFQSKSEVALHFQLLHALNGWWSLHTGRDNGKAHRNFLCKHLKSFYLTVLDIRLESKKDIHFGLMT